MNFVLLIKLFEKTGSSIATSLLWVAYALPAIFIGPFAAACVDIFDRRKILIITNLLQSLTIFFYAISNRSSFFLLYGTVIAYSFLNQFYVPAESATLPAVLPKKMLPQGNSLFFLTMQASLVIGFGIAGFLNQLVGFDKTLYICSTLVFLAFLSVTFLPKIKGTENLPSDFEQTIINFFQRIIEGYNFIKSQRLVWGPIALLMAMQIGLAIITINLPVIARDILGVSLNLVGIMVVVPSAIGAALGAVIIPKLISRGWRKKRMIESSLFLITILFLILTFGIPQFSQNIRPIMGMITVLLLGALFIGVVVPSQTFLQEATPGGLRGRVFGNFWFLVTIATIFPTIFSGTVSELFGIHFLLFILGAISFSGFFISKKFGHQFIT